MGSKRSLRLTKLVSCQRCCARCVRETVTFRTASVSEPDLTSRRLGTLTLAVRIADGVHPARERRQVASRR